MSDEKTGVSMKDFYDFMVEHERRHSQTDKLIVTIESNQGVAKCDADEIKKSVEAIEKILNNGLIKRVNDLEESRNRVLSRFDMYISPAIKDFFRAAAIVVAVILIQHSSTFLSALGIKIP